MRNKNQCQSVTISDNVPALSFQLLSHMLDIPIHVKLLNRTMIGKSTKYNHYRCQKHFLYQMAIE